MQKLHLNLSIFLLFLFPSHNFLFCGDLERCTKALVSPRVSLSPALEALQNSDPDFKILFGDKKGSLNFSNLRVKLFHLDLSAEEKGALIAHTVSYVNLKVRDGQFKVLKGLIKLTSLLRITDLFYFSENEIHQTWLQSKGSVLETA